VEQRHALRLELQGVSAELDSARKDLRRVVGQLVRLHEEEYKSVARELHDFFSQKLATISMELDAVTVQAKDVSANFADRLAVVKTEIVDFAKQLHQMSRRLHPSMLRQVGLKAALRDECSRWSMHFGISLECEMANVPDLVAEEIIIALFRVTQEALNNIAKHARTSRARLRLSGDAGALKLLIEDFGQGFDVRKNAKGLGFITMEERIRNLNGRFGMRSNPGQGTVIEAEVPLNLS
jgi:signal transduction histidine kinase